MPSIERRITPDEKARAPFAVLAVLIFLLSSFSVAYLGATTRQEIINDLLRSEQEAIDEIECQLQNELDTGIYFVGVETLRKILTEINTPGNMTEPIDLGLTDEAFQQNLDGYLSEQLPRDVRGYHIEKTEHELSLHPKIEKLHDLVPNSVGAFDSNASYESGNFSKLNTKQSETFGVTNATRSYSVTGYLNITIASSQHRLKLNRTVWVDREIDVPLPFLLRRMNLFQSELTGGLSEIARLTRYILTTIAQYRVFQGYGIKRSSVPSELAEELHIRGDDATDVLTVEDVELAVNLALLLLSAKTFRTWDTQVSEELSHLLSEYVMGGTIDAADLIVLYLGNGENLDLGVILAQAFYGILDQFILRYLDYTGVMPLADGLWKGVQIVDGVLQQAGEAINDVWDWFTGKSPESWHDVLGNWLEQKISDEGGLESDFFLRLLVGDRSGSEFASFNGEIVDAYPAVDIFEAGFVLEFVVRQTDEYHTWYSNGSEQPHRFRLSDNDTIVGHDSVVFNIEVSFASYSHQIAFEEVDVGEEIDRSCVWRDFHEDFFAREDEEVSYAESLREDLRKVALRITEDAVRRARTLVNNHRLAPEVNSSDGRAFLTDLKYEIESAMDDILGFYKSPQGREEISEILKSLSNEGLRLLEDLKHFLSREYDSFVDYPSILQSPTESVALSVLENGISFEILSSKLIENTNIEFDWAFNGNMTEDEIPLEEIRRIFSEGGVRSREQFTSLQSALLDDTNLAYQLMKKREVDLGLNQSSRGVLVQAIEVAEEKASRDLVSLFVGEAVDILDGVGLIDMVLEAVDNFLEGIVDGIDTSNTQLILPLGVGEPFEFWEGDYYVALEDGIMRRVSLQVDQAQDYLHAKWSNIDSSTMAPDGTLYVDFHPQGFSDGDAGYDAEDIAGKHYTDVMSSSQRPFETKWNISVLGRASIHLRTQERALLGPGGHQSVYLNRSVEIRFSTTIVVYTGWELEGVDYDLTNTILSDIIDFINVVWDAIKDPVMDVFDYFQVLMDFLGDVTRIVMEYGSHAMRVLAEATDVSISLLQIFLSKTLSVVSESLANFLRNLGMKHFFIEFAGLTFEIKLTDGREKKDCQCDLWARAGGDLIGVDFEFVTYLVEFERPVDDMEHYIFVDGRLRFGQGGFANVTIDPFILVHPYFVEIHATELNSKGDGWALDLHSPEVDVYKNSRSGLSDIVGFVPTIPLPMFGVEVGVDFGINVKYEAPDSFSSALDVKLAMHRILKESFHEGWQDIELPLAPDSFASFVQAVVQSFINKLTDTLERRIVEVVLVFDLTISSLGSGGAVGGGFSIGLVMDRTALFGLLYRFMDVTETILTNVHNPFDSLPFPLVPDDLLEHMAIRFEVYSSVGYPKMFKRLSSFLKSGQSPKKMKLAVSIQPNVPALVLLAGADWGRWRVDFGVYLEDFPLSILSSGPTLSVGTVVDLYVLKGQIHEVCQSCR